MTDKSLFKLPFLTLTTILSYLYGKTWLSVYLCVYVTRMDGQTACLILTKIREWIAIYPAGNIGGLKFTPRLSKWSPPREVDLENLPDETFVRPLLSNISGAT